MRRFTLIFRAFRFLSGIFLLAAVLVPATANGVLEYFGSSADKSKSFDNPTPANALSFVSTWGHQMPTVGGQQRLYCSAFLTNNGVPVNGVRVRGDGFVFNAQGQSLGALPPRTRTTNTAGQAFFDYSLINFRNTDTLIAYRMLFQGSKLITDATMNCVAADRKPCVENQTTACVNGGAAGSNRFQIEAFGSSGAKLPVLSSTGNEAHFLSGSSSVELVVKVQNSCRANNHFWVFADGLRDPRTFVTVTDTVQRSVRTYINPLGRPVQPIQDTSAFATCP